MPVIIAGILILTVFNNWGFIRFFAASPTVFDGSSVGWMLSRDLLPVIEIIVSWLALRGLGFKILKKLMAKDMPAENSGVMGSMEGFAYGMGLGTAGLAVFLMGVAGFFNPIGLTIFCLLAIAVAAHEYRISSRRHSGESRNPSLNERRMLWTPACAGVTKGNSDSGKFWRLCDGSFVKTVCIALIAYAAWHILIVALAPPTEWDVLAYHLAIPKLYWRYGHIQEIHWLVHSHWPHLMEALYVMPLALGQDNLAALLHASVCAALVITVFSVARRQWGELAAWVSATLLIAQPIVLRFSGTAHSDGALALFYFLASLAVWNGVSQGSRRWLIFGGLLAGFCASAKLHGIILTVLLAAQILYMSLRSKVGRGNAWRPAALFLSSGLLVVFPWYLKTWIATGNPAWPFLPGLFGDQWGATSVTAAPGHLGSLRWLLDPERLFHDGPQYLLFTVPLICVLTFFMWIPAFAGMTKRGSPVRLGQKTAFPLFLTFLVMPMIPYLTVVAVRDSAWRFCWPFYPALCLCAGWAIAQIWNSAGLGIKAIALIIFAFGVSPAVRASQNNQLFEAFGIKSSMMPGVDPRWAYLERGLGIYSFCQAVNRTFPKAKALLFREIRGYFLDIDYMWGDPTNQGMIRYDEMRDSRELAQALTRLGITHVWVNEGVPMYQPSPNYYTPKIISLMNGVLHEHARLVLKEGTNSLYQLEIRHSPQPLAGNP